MRFWDIDHTSQASVLRDILDDEYAPRHPLWALYGRSQKEMKRLSYLGTASVASFLWLVFWEGDEP